jgi:hypothetical protein
MAGGWSLRHWLGRPLRGSIQADGPAVPRGGQADDRCRFHGGGTVARAGGTWDDFWRSNSAPTGPQGKMINGMSPQMRELLRTRLRNNLPIASDGRIAYEAFANAVKGRVPG